ncbi:GHKL domain-containing protein [Sharpea porci]
MKIGEGSFFWSVTISNATLNTSMLKTSKTDKKNHGFGLKHVKEIVK